MKCYFKVRSSYLTLNDDYHSVNEIFEDANKAMEYYNDTVELYKCLKKDGPWKYAEVEMKVVNEVLKALI